MLTFYIGMLPLLHSHFIFTGGDVIEYEYLSEQFWSSLFHKMTEDFPIHIRTCKTCRNAFYLKTCNVVQKWINLVLNEEDVDHDVRFNLVTLLMFLRYSKESIVNLILSKARWSDKDEKFTIYQIEHIYNKGYKLRKSIYEKLFVYHELPEWK